MGSFISSYEYTEATLTEARALLETPDRWSRQSAPTWTWTYEVLTAPSLDLVTAIRSAAFRVDDRLRIGGCAHKFLFWNARDAVSDELRRRYPSEWVTTMFIQRWNDAPERMHADVLALLDEALAEVRRKREFWDRPRVTHYPPPMSLIRL